MVLSFASQPGRQPAFDDGQVVARPRPTDTIAGILRAAYTPVQGDERQMARLLAQIDPPAHLS